MSSIPLPALDVKTPTPPNPLAEFARVTQLQNIQQEQQQRAQQIQSGNITLQQQQMDLHDQQTMRSLAPTFTQKDADGKVTGFDSQGYYGALMGGGVNPQKIVAMQNQQAEATKNIAAAGTAQIELGKAKNDQAYQLSEGFKSLALDPKADPAQVQQSYQNVVPRLQQLGVDVSKFPTQFPSDQTAAKNAIDGWETGLGVHKQILADAETAAKTAADVSKARESNATAKIKEIEGQALDAISPNYIMQTALDPVTRNQALNALQLGDRQGAKDALKAGFESQLGIQKEIDPRVQSNRIATSVAQGQAMAQMQQHLLEGPAQDMAAENYFQTGQLPAGARSPGIISSIINRAAQLHPTGSLAGNKAAFEANTASLKNVTGTLDTLTAFENTGLKNLKQFTDLTDKLPDTGVPWLNSPIRSLDKNLVGAQWLPAVEAARTVALREIARVTNDPKLSG